MTRKLKLELDTLCVESFEMAAPEEGAGTVRGHAAPSRRSCADTCQDSCFITCEATCMESCEPCASNPTACATGVPICCIA